MFKGFGFDLGNEFKFTYFWGPGISYHAQREGGRGRSRKFGARILAAIQLHLAMSLQHSCICTVSLHTASGRLVHKALSLSFGSLMVGKAALHC